MGVAAAAVVALEQNNS